MRNYCLCLVFFFSFHFTNAQSDDNQELTLEEMNKKRQNPVEGLRSFFLQSVLIPDTGEGGTAQSYSIQPVWPFKVSEHVKLMTYTIIPLQYIPKLEPAGESAFGLGNILFNGFFTPVEKKGKFVYGAGPAIQIPTRTDANLGSNTVSLGPSLLLYYAGDKISGGAVVQNYWSLGGTGANKVDLFSVQYMGYYNFSKGWFASANSTIEADWLAPSDQRWLVPVGGGAGKTFKLGQSKKFYCGTAQLFYNAIKPDYVGRWEIIFQLQVIL